MSTAVLIESPVSSIASLLIPIHTKQLLVPNVSVAEIIPVTAVAPVTDAPDWYLGNFQWREQTIPLLSLETLNDDPLGDFNPRTRFTIFNTTGSSASLPFIAIVAQGLPRLARVQETDLVIRETHLRDYELAAVNWNGDDAIIPNIAAIETTFLHYLGAATQ